MTRSRPALLPVWGEGGRFIGLARGPAVLFGFALVKAWRLQPAALTVPGPYHISLASYFFPDLMSFTTLKAP